MSDDFTPFPKVPRLNREVLVTEKIDGTNAQVVISEDGTQIRAGSRNRWISLDADNMGFARWVEENRDELLMLGPGRHFGEWWGSGIQRAYDLPKGEKRFSLFNVARWDDDAPEVNGFGVPQPRRPACCQVVPTLYRGSFDMRAIDRCLDYLRSDGSAAAPGFMRPEGIIVFHTAANSGFKVTLEKDEEPKSAAEWRAKQARTKSATLAPSPVAEAGR